MVVVAIIVAAVLVSLADDCADSGSGCAADDGSFEAAAEDCAEKSAATRADESAFSGTDSALIAISVVVTVVVVIAATTAVANSVIEVGILISILGAGSHRQEICGQHERGDEYSFSYLHHAGFDAGLMGCVRIFFADCVSTPYPEGLLVSKSSFFMT